MLLRTQHAEKLKRRSGAEPLGWPGPFPHAPGQGLGTVGGKKKSNGHRLAGSIGPPWKGALATTRLLKSACADRHGHQVATRIGTAEPERRPGGSGLAHTPLTAVSSVQGVLRLGRRKRRLIQASKRSQRACGLASFHVFRNSLPQALVNDVRHGPRPVFSACANPLAQQPGGSSGRASSPSVESPERAAGVLRELAHPLLPAERTGFADEGRRVLVVVEAAALNQPAPSTSRHYVPVAHVLNSRDASPYCSIIILSDQ